MSTMDYYPAQTPETTRAVRGLIALRNAIAAQTAPIELSTEADR